MKPLILTGAIPGLLRRGSPVRHSGHLGGQHVGYVVPCGDGYFYTCPLEEPSPFRRRPLMRAECCHVSAKGLHEITLDLTDPTGRFHALLWLRERGHDLRWAEGEPEVLAWSVLSVSRGGRPLSGLLPMWAPESRDGSDWDETRGWIACVGPDGWSLAFVGVFGPETGAEGRAAADRAALAAGYALRNEDGLTLPPLPEVRDGE